MTRTPTRADAKLLDPTARRVLTELERAADAGLPCPTSSELAAVIGSEWEVTAVRAVDRLERKGFIERIKYQRERQIMITSTGNQTAAARTPALHWRQRPLAIATPSIASLQARNFDFAREVQNAARAEGKDLVTFLGDLVFEAMRARAIQANPAEA